jgi:hypothetical protein
MMMRPSPAVALLRACCPPADREAILGDLCEEFQIVIDARGTAHARAWLWRQSIISAPPLLALRLGNINREASLLTSCLAIALGCIAVVAIQGLAGAVGYAAGHFGVRGDAQWMRVLDSLLAFAVGGYATARIAKPRSRDALAAFCACCVGISFYFLWPVAGMIEAAGTAQIFYHLLLLALVIPSSIAGGALAGATRTLKWPLFSNSV